MNEREQIPICAREIQNLNHARALTTNLFNLRQCGLLCDITLLSGSIEITAHKVVLAACSEYFQAMFTTGLCETGKAEIPMKHINTNALSILVNYAYTGVIYIDEMNVQTLLETADLLQFQSAKSLCCDFIKEQLNAENCLDVFGFADVYHCEDILTLSQTVFNKNWKNIIQSESFFELDIEVFVKLISSDTLQVAKEADVFEMILIWIEVHMDERKKFLLTLLSYVRWPFVEPLKLKSIENQSLIVSNKKALDLIHSILIPSPLDMSTATMRNSYSSWMYILGGEQSFLKEMKTCEFFNNVSGEWKYGFSLNAQRTSFAAVTHGDKLYVLGGMRHGEKLKIVECYDHKQGKWKRLATLKKCKGDVEAAIIDDVVYVAGGSSDGEPACRYVEKYDESNNQWNLVAAMKSKRRRFGLCEYRSKLYAFGGFQDSSGELCSCEVYDPESNAWGSIAPMKTYRCDLGVTVLSDCIYIAGGVNSYTGSICTVEKYTPATDSWCLCAPLKHARGGHAMVCYFGRIVAIGGTNSYMETCKDAEWYNEVTDSWSVLPHTNMPRFGAVGVVLPYCRRSKSFAKDDIEDTGGG